MEYIQFKNEVLNLIYGSLPSYAYFSESILQADLEDGYWHDFSEDEVKKILIYFSNNYLHAPLTEETIIHEDWDVVDMLITLLLDYF